ETPHVTQAPICSNAILPLNLHGAACGDRTAPQTQIEHRRVVWEEKPMRDIPDHFPCRRWIARPDVREGEPGNVANERSPPFTKCHLACMPFCRLAILARRRD